MTSRFNCNFVPSGCNPNIAFPNPGYCLYTQLTHAGMVNYIDYDGWRITGTLEDGATFNDYSNNPWTFWNRFSNNNMLDGDYYPYNYIVGGTACTTSIDPAGGITYGGSSTAIRHWWTDRRTGFTSNWIRTFLQISNAYQSTGDFDKVTYQVDYNHNYSTDVSNIGAQLMRLRIPAIKVRKPGTATDSTVKSLGFLYRGGSAAAPGDSLTGWDNGLGKFTSGAMLKANDGDYFTIYFPNPKTNLGRNSANMYWRHWGTVPNPSLPYTVITFVKKARKQYFTNVSGCSTQCDVQTPNMDGMYFGLIPDDKSSQPDGKKIDQTYQTSWNVCQFLERPNGTIANYSAPSTSSTLRGYGSRTATSGTPESWDEMTFEVRIGTAADLAGIDAKVAEMTADLATGYASANTFNTTNRMAAINIPQVIMANKSADSSSALANNNPRKWGHEPYVGNRVKCATSGTVDAAGAKEFRRWLLYGNNQMISGHTNTWSGFIPGVISRCQAKNIYAVLLWDIEGGQYPGDYVGDPTALNLSTPEMNATVTTDATYPNGSSLKTVDEMFKKLRDAGFQTGVTLRPQIYKYSSGGYNWYKFDMYNPATLSVQIDSCANELARKAFSAWKKWGVQFFYVDSPYGRSRSTVPKNDAADGGILLDSRVFERARQFMLDSVNASTVAWSKNFEFIPETAKGLAGDNIKYYQVTSPLSIYPASGRTKTPPFIANIYPNAKIVNNIGFNSVPSGFATGDWPVIQNEAANCREMVMQQAFTDLLSLNYVATPPTYPGSNCFLEGGNSQIMFVKTDLSVVRPLRAVDTLHLSTIADTLFTIRYDTISYAQSLTTDLNRIELHVDTNYYQLRWRTDDYAFPYALGSISGSYPGYAYAPAAPRLVQGWHDITTRSFRGTFPGTRGAQHKVKVLVDYLDQPNTAHFNVLNARTNKFRSVLVNNDTIRLTLPADTLLALQYDTLTATLDVAMQQVAFTLDSGTAGVRTGNVTNYPYVFPGKNDRFTSNTYRYPDIDYLGFAPKLATGWHTLHAVPKNNSGVNGKKARVRFYVKYVSGSRIGEENASFALYPNPAKDELTAVVYPASVQKAWITNAEGRQFAATYSKAAGSVCIDISTLGKGLYALSLALDSGEVKTVRFVKE